MNSPRDDDERRDEPRGDTFDVNIGGDVSGQIAVGRGITQKQVRTVLTPEFLAEIRTAVSEVRSRVEEQAPPELVAEANAQLDQLSQAISEEEPSPEELPSRMERVRNWFIEHLPSMAGTVSSLVIHPIVGRLVEVAGDHAADSLKRRFGMA